MNIRRQLVIKLFKPVHFAIEQEQHEALISFIIKISDKHIKHVVPSDLTCNVLRKPYKGYFIYIQGYDEKVIREFINETL